MKIIICRDHDIQVDSDIDSLRLVFMRDQHDLCPTNLSIREHLDSIAHI